MRLMPRLHPLRRLATLFWGLFLVGCGGAAAGAPGAAPTPTPDPVVIQGEQVFQAHCAICHALVPETIIVGPSLAGIATRAAGQDANQSAEQYVQLSILRPDAYLVPGYADAMPQDFGKKLTGEELDRLVAFLMTLK